MKKNQWKSLPPPQQPKFYVGEDGQEVLDVWGTTLAGGRHGKVCDWNFTPVVLPLEANGKGVNKVNGDAALFAGFNPNLHKRRQTTRCLPWCIQR